MAEYEYIVEMNHITKRFPGIIANDDVTIRVKKGEIFAILGENGAGKSTLMSMLFGTNEPDEGEIMIKGEKVQFNSSNDASRYGIGMVHQHFKLVSNYTVAENIVMGREPKKKALGLIPVVDIKKANKEIAELSERYGLKVNPLDIIENLNVSTRQRVEILKMLYREAEILIFDEPTAVLTPQEIDSLLEIINGLRDSGKTIILITHKLNEIKRIADRCAILQRGRLIDVLDVATTDTKTMANLMVGHEISFKTERKEAVIGETVLKVEHLTVKNADKFKVVDDVSFEVHKGEVFSIAGVAGNGQVEIADAIYGLLPISEGNIYINGQDISKYSIRQRTEAGMCYIPEDRQEYGLVLDFDIKNNSVLKQYYLPQYSEGRILRKLKKDKIREHGKQLIDNYDIRCAEAEDTVVRGMSGGNQQKVIIAREVELDSELMIFVQPTRGLDIGAIERIRKMIVAERDKGKAILLVSLELDEIMDISDTISIIYNGQIQRIAAANELTTNQVGEYMMGVKIKKGEDNE